MQIRKYIEGAKRNEAEAFRSLYECYAQQMFATSYRITNNKEDSKDILQESFLKSFTDIDKLLDANKYGSWLKRIVINNSLAFIKKRIMHSATLSDDIQETGEGDNWFEGISMRRIKEEIHKLPDGCRVVFSLYAIEDLKHREIAEQLEISPSTSKSQYKYACILLRKKLGKMIHNGN